MIIPCYYENPHTLHVGTMPNRAYYIPASRRSDQIALTVRVGAAQCIPCIIKLLPTLGVCIHIFLQRDAEVRICIHSDIFHCAGEHGREIFFLGRLQFGVALHLVALIYDGHGCPKAAKR